MTETDSDGYTLCSECGARASFRVLGGRFYCAKHMDRVAGVVVLVILLVIVIGLAWWLL